MNPMIQMPSGLQMPQGLGAGACPQGQPLDALVSKLASDLSDLQQQMRAVQLGGDGGGGGGAPGLPACAKQEPYWYSAEIRLPAGTVARTPGTFTVSQDGPFVALALQAAWRETSAPFGGRWLPPSSEELYLRALASFNFSNPPRPDTIDFSFEIQDGNSDRNWQDKPVPSSFLYSAEGQPAYLPVPAVFQPNTTVTVYVTPIRPVTADGMLTFTFWGYKALGQPQVARSY